MNENMKFLKTWAEWSRAYQSPLKATRQRLAVEFKPDIQPFDKKAATG